MVETQQLLARIDALAQRTKAQPSTLSRKLFGNGNRLDEIRKGGSLTLATYGKVLEKLSDMEGAA